MKQLVAWFLLMMQVTSKPRFFGVLGPHHRIQPTTPLLYFFTKPGILQGVFFDDEDPRVTPVFRRHSLRPLFSNIIANTALLQVPEMKKTRVYALYEHDVPVEIAIDMRQKTLQTVGRVKEAGVWSGHTKWNDATKTVDTLRYSIFDKTVTVSVKTADLQTLQEVCVCVPGDGVAIVHDFVRVDAERVVFAVTPFEGSVWPVPRLSLAKEKDKSMQFYVVNMTSGESEVFPVEGPPSLLFHYGNAYVDAATGNVVVHAAVYEDVDFAQPPHLLRGRYRQYFLLRNARVAMVHRAAELEGQNLDFPVLMEPMGPRSLVCLRQIKDCVFDKLVVLRGVDTLREFHFPGRFLCSEPSFDPETNHLYGLSWNVENPSRTYFWRLAWPGGQLREWPIDTGGEPLYHGFHRSLI